MPFLDGQGEVVEILGQNKGHGKVGDRQGLDETDVEESIENRRGKSNLGKVDLDKDHGLPNKSKDLEEEDYEDADLKDRSVSYSDEKYE